MEQSEYKIKKTKEWNALNAIWKACTTEQKTQLKSDFKVVAKFIREKHSLNTQSSVDHNYAYLNGISEEAKHFVISVVDKGEKNIYHSIMAILSTKSQLRKEELKAYYFQKYRTKRPYLIENSGLVTEVINLCWDKFHNNK